MRQEAPRSYRRRRDPRTAESYYQHRAVAAWKFGRDLAAGEVVHHINGDRRNNHPDNIWIFSSQRAHMLWHHYRWREARGVHHPFSVEELLEVHGEWVRRRGAPQLSELQATEPRCPASRTAPTPAQARPVFRCHARR